MSGELKGEMLKSVKEDTALLGSVPVYCTGSHDTASAVASIPSVNNNYAFISSGTWSLIGIEREKALIDDVVF